MFKVTRTFQPVGQGAFYSESLRLNDKQSFNVVYDCGSKEKIDWLRTRIANTGFPTKRKVDVCFLSHFHADHYKGIETLNPNIIILPLLKEWDKVIFWIGHQLGMSSFNANFEEELHKKLPNAKLFRISPTDEEVGNPTFIETYNITQLSNSGNPNILPSGTKFTFGKECDWIYIPINPCLDKEIVNTFLNLINDPKKGLDIEKLKSLDTVYFNTKKTTLKNIYSKIGSPNEYSMAVYSGPINFNDVVYRSKIFPITPSCELRRCPFWEHRYYTQYFNPGCLYLGDMNLNNMLEPLKIIYKFIGNDCQNYIGTIQVPHHGSKDNFNPLLLWSYILEEDRWEPRKDPLIFVISVGENNTYGHPSSFLIEELVNSGNYIKLVTEKSTSLLMEEYELE